MEYTDREWSGDAVAWISWAVLNPFGPTFLAMGMRRQGDQHRIFLRSMHMLGGYTVFLEPGPGPTDLQDIGDAAKRIDAFLRHEHGHGMFTTPPSFVLVRQDQDALLTTFFQMYLELAGDELDLVGEIASVRQYGTDFFARASSDINSALTNLAGGQERSEPSITEDDVLWWLKSISSKEFSEVGFKTLIYMWQEASKLNAAKVSNGKVIGFALDADLLPERLIPKS